MGDRVITSQPFNWLRAMAGSRSRLLVLGAFAVIYLVWRSTYLAVALALTSMPPFLLMGTRSIFGGLALLAGAWASGRAVHVRTCARAAGCGILLFVGCHGTLAYAQQHIPSALAAVLLATIPFWIVLIIAILPGGETPTLKQIGLLVPGFVGVALIVVRQAETDSSIPMQVDLILVVVAAISWAAGTGSLRTLVPSRLARRVFGHGIDCRRHRVVDHQRRAWRACVVPP
jgi:drug/metabolite transporter (DMT)-like permease